MKNIPLYLWNTIIYALVAALFGISSAFNAYRYVKDKQKKEEK